MNALLFFAFISGLVTILAPCIWPLLPIVFSASSGSGTKRPLGLSLGIISSFALLTLSISYLEKLFPIDPGIFRAIAVMIIAGLGLAMIFPALGARLESLASRMTGSFHRKNNTQGTGFGAGYWTGFSIGMVWAPCAGPILAAIATLAATQAVNSRVILVTLAYVSGLGIPLFLFALTGSAFFGRLRQFTPFTGRIQQAFGVVMIVSAILIYTNVDKTIQARILDAFPGYSQFLTRLENQSGIDQSLAALQPQQTVTQRTAPMNSNDLLPDYGPAPEFQAISHWLNTPNPLSMADLKGKVVLVDFWTYSCINCVRTLPHITAWHAKYKDAGLIVIGVHTPEFAFEKEAANVAQALQQFKIHYPVALDNSFGTWQAYDNHYWPAHYLIDTRGHIRETHFGEGNYDATEEAIRTLLQEGGRSVATAVKTRPDEAPSMARTPETYLGLARLERFASRERPHQGEQTFTLPIAMAPDHFAYDGRWSLDDESARPGQNAALEIRFRAAKVFLVVTPGAKAPGIRILLDGRPIADEEAGADVNHGILQLDAERLYHVVTLKNDRGPHLLRLEFTHSGAAVYAFTFG